MAENNYIQFPDEVAALFGERSENGRIYHLKGGAGDFDKWIDNLAAHVGAFLSPGDVALYLGITQPSVYERMTKGKITSFRFEFVEDEETGGRVRANDVVRFPLSECVTWREARREKLPALAKAEIRDMEAKMADLQAQLERERAFNDAKLWRVAKERVARRYNGFGGGHRTISEDEMGNPEVQQAIQDEYDDLKS